MPVNDYKRKLSAIFSADVAGYSRMMGEDEAATVEAITTSRKIMSELIRQHRGRVVDSPGDNLLAEFASVVDAVQCAVAVQKEFQTRNAELPENRRMAFRIGINLGDVIEEEGRIYGDGVNIAARLESLADPGGICVSKTAFDHIETKLPLGYEFLGEKDVKNIAKPVGAYRVLMEPRVTVARGVERGRRLPVRGRKAMVAAGIILILAAMAAWVWHDHFRRPAREAASVKNTIFPLSEKPSIAVLPFDNLSGDPAQDYIADGISENIISALSKVSEMVLIDRNSTSTYKGKPVKVQEVGKDLGVRYVLEGSAQVIGNRIRVTAQLIDAASGHHLWSEKYDRDMKDLFVVQDEITHQIIVELQVKLTEGEQARISRQSTANLEAWNCAVRGLNLFERASKENNAKAMALFQRAVELDPGYVWAWVRLAWTHLVASKYSPSPSESFKKAVQIARKTVAMDDSDADVHALLGNIYSRQHRYEEAIKEGQKALALGPTNAQAHVLLAATMNAVGRFDEAISLVKRAMRLHPYYPAYYLMWLGVAYRMTGHYDEAVATYKELLDRAKKEEFPLSTAHLFLAEVYGELGQEEKARKHAEEVRTLEPGFSLERVGKLGTYGYKDPTHLERRMDALRKAGFQ